MVFIETKDRVIVVVIFHSLFLLSWDPEAAVWQLIVILFISDVLSARFLILDDLTTLFHAIFTHFFFSSFDLCLMKLHIREKVSSIDSARELLYNILL